ncbi:MAG: SDR family oxidoreductase [Propionibacteriaceae bacterium]|nr:SDR family oxidoreductase [Propionibacteriaceae bacterium]
MLLVARAEAVVGSQIPFFIYNSTKQAFARWVRRHAATPEWAGASITLNAVAPGAVLTPLIASMFDDPQIVDDQAVIPEGSALLKDVAQPSEVAALLGWLGSTANSHLCGQIIFIDGGSEVIMRGEQHLVNRRLNSAEKEPAFHRHHLTCNRLAKRNH